VNMASASLSYDWKVFNTGLNADYAIDDESALYMTFNISKSLDLGSLGAKDYISLEPTFQLAGATQRITTTEVIPPPQRGGFLPLPLSKKARKPQYREVTTTSFDLLSYNLKLPLAYNRANYAIEATYQGSVLSKAASDSQKIRSFFNLGFYYIF
ncbi:MAG: hypothetical protein H7Y07_18765, partial [Pyrinomonadaceae bacterium]|nr:hypothetical protein [Sphingobacteriaceae bacterium]